MGSQWQVRAQKGSQEVQIRFWTEKFKSFHCIGRDLGTNMMMDNLMTWVISAFVLHTIEFYVCFPEYHTRIILFSQFLLSH